MAVFAQVSYAGSGVAGSNGRAQLFRKYFSSKLLDFLKRTTITAGLVDSEPLPENHGVSMTFHRVNTIDSSVTPNTIDEDMGSPWDGDGAHTVRERTLNVDEVTVDIGMYGNDMRFTEKFLRTSEPSVLPKVMESFNYVAAATIERLHLNMLTSTAVGGGSTLPSQRYNDGVVTVSAIWGDGSTTLTEGTLDADVAFHHASAESFNKAYTILRSRGVMPHPQGQGGYVAVLHPVTCGDLRLDPTFMEIVYKGGDGSKDLFASAELGKVFGIRIFESSLVSTIPGAIDVNDGVYRQPIFGSGYFCSTSLGKGGGAPKVTWIPPTAQIADPYGNTGFVVWKGYWAGAVTNPHAGIVLKTASLLQDSGIVG